MRPENQISKPIKETRTAAQKITRLTSKVHKTRLAMVAADGVGKVNVLIVILFVIIHLSHERVARKQPSPVYMKDWRTFWSAANSSLRRAGRIQICHKDVPAGRLVPAGSEIGRNEFAPDP